MASFEFPAADRLMRFEPALRRCVEAILVILLALIAAWLAWLVAAPTFATAPLMERPLPSPIVDTEVGDLEADRTLLVRLNPFEGGAPSGEIMPDAPETQLNLRLTGLFMSTEAFGGSARIVLPNNQAKSFVPGDEIISGVTLERILSDRVVLTRNGVTEVLRLGNRGDGLMVIGDSSLSRSAETPARGSAAAAPIVKIEDPDVLLQAVNLSPQERSGRLYGYRLSARGDAEALKALGFEEGDILVEVNGQSAARLNFNQLMTEIGATRIATLSVDRRGSLQSMRLEFEE